MKTSKPFSNNSIDDIVAAVVTPLATGLFSNCPQESLKNEKRDELRMPSFDYTNETAESPNIFEPQHLENDHDSFASNGLASLAEASSARETDCAGVEEMKAANILRSMKTDVKFYEDAEDIVETAVEILMSDQDSEVDDTSENNVEEMFVTAPSASRQLYKLHFPNRLATDDDVEEVNQLHQFVRSELLEIFALPESDLANSNDSPFKTRDVGHVIVSPPVNRFSDGPKTRRHSARRQAFSPPPVPAALQQRLYPGRVGMRCVYCANCKSKATKAAFYPIRLKNIYRETCAWQRIHFKKCHMVPSHVRQKYEHLKKTDLSRGKVRYWESSARKIGLMNNPERDDGIIYASNA